MKRIIIFTPLRPPLYPRLKSVQHKKSGIINLLTINQSINHHSVQVRADPLAKQKIALRQGQNNNFIIFSMIFYITHKQN